MSSPLPYQPPEHLVSSSSLTAAQLTSQFEAFKSSLGYASSAPELVFERVVANLCSAKPSIVQPITEEHSNDLKRSIKTLQDELRSLKDDVTKLALTNASRPETTTYSTRASPASDLPPSAIKFSFVLGDYGIGIRADPYDSDDGRYGAGCRWSDLQQQDSRVQFGSYNTAEDNEDSLPIEICWQSIIRFSPPFAEPPTVVVWLTGVDMRCERPCHITVTSEEVWEQSFDISITPSESGIVYSASVSWVAFPSNQTKYSIGMFNKLVYGTCNAGGLPEAGGVHTHGSSTPTKTVFAIDKYVRACGGDLSFVLKQTYPAKEDYIIWNVELAKDSRAMCELGIIYIGVC